MSKPSERPVNAVTKATTAEKSSSFENGGFLGGLLAFTLLFYLHKSLLHIWSRALFLAALSKI